MKEFFKNLFLYLLIGFFVLNIFKGIQLSTDVIYIISTLLVIAIGMLIGSPLLKFLTISENFLTKFVITSLILIGLMFLLQTFMVGFVIEQYTVNSIYIGNIVINSFEMIPVVIIIVSSVIASFISSLFFVLEKSK